MRSPGEIRQEVKRRQRMSDDELGSYLIGQGRKVSRFHYVPRISAGKAKDARTGSFATYRRESKAGIDQAMLRKMRSAFRNDDLPEVDDLLESIWDVLRERVCKRLKIC